MLILLPKINSWGFEIKTHFLQSNLPIPEWAVAEFATLRWRRPGFTTAVSPATPAELSSGGRPSGTSWLAAGSPAAAPSTWRTGGHARPVGRTGQVRGSSCCSRQLSHAIKTQLKALLGGFETKFPPDDITSWDLCWYERIAVTVRLGLHCFILSLIFVGVV